MDGEIQTAAPPSTTPVAEAAAPEAQVLGTEAQTEAPAAEGTTEDAPEPIEYNFTLPEGMELDAELSSEFKEFAKEKNLSNEDAQRLIDLNLKAEAKRAQAFQATQQEWQQSAKSDTEYGGSKWDTSIAVANKALDAFGTPELKDLLKSSGFGNHPEVIRAFVRVGQSVGEDQLVMKTPMAPSTNQRDPVNIYKKSNMK